MNAIECFQTYSTTASAITQILSRIPDDFVPDSVVRAWEEGGLLVPGWKGLDLSRVWTNVIAHQGACAIMTHRLASRLEKPLAKEGTSPRDVVVAALVHDAFKRREFEMHEAARAAGQNVMKANDEAERASSEFLRKLGFSDQVVGMAGTTGDTGMYRVADGKATLGQKLAFYTDVCVSNEQIVGYQKRFDDLLIHFQPGGRYDWIDPAFLKKHGKTHRQMYDSAVLPLQDELAALLGFSGDPKDLYLLATS